MIAALHAEWTKLRSVRSSTWSVVAIVGTTVAVTAFLAAVGHTDATRAGQGDDDIVANSLLGVYLGQIAVVALAVMTITSEYATGMIRTTIAAVPARGVVLGAKTAVVASVVLVTTLVASIGSFLVAQPLLHSGGYVPPAYPFVSLSDGPVLRAIVGTALFLTALAIFSVGVGAVLRNTAAAISVVLGLVLVPLLVAPAFPLEIREAIQRATPVAGLAVQATIDRADNIPIGPWTGLAVTFAWAGAAMTVAWWAMRRRDV